MAIIFDLDGTLINSLDDIAAAANHALATLGQPTHTVEEYRYKVGYGADVLFQKALPADAQHLVPGALVRFKAYYAEHMDDHTRLYDGVGDMLDALQRRGIPLAVLSNKPHAATVAIVKKMLGRWQFAAVAGHRENVPKKPAPEPALALAAELQVEPRRVYFVGDAEPDMQTAAAAGMNAVGALWGFRSREELIHHGAKHLIAHPLELLDVIDHAV